MNTDSRDIMWKYYEKEKNYSSAARILAKLADRDTDTFTLWDRIDYISRAILCAKACRTSLNNEVIDITLYLSWSYCHHIIFVVLLYFALNCLSKALTYLFCWFSLKCRSV